MELGYVLDELLDISSKIIAIAAGSEMEAQAARIADHFQRQVRPVASAAAAVLC